MRFPGSRFSRLGSAFTFGVEWILPPFDHCQMKVQVGATAQERKIRREKTGCSAQERPLNCHVPRVAVSLTARVTLGALPSSYDVGDKAEGPWGIEVKAFENSCALGRPMLRTKMIYLYLRYMIHVYIYHVLLCLYMGARCTCIIIEL